jgi:hypothetical protein
MDRLHSNGSASKPSDLLRHALEYAAIGFNILPVRRKKPALPSWEPLRRQPLDGAALTESIQRPGVTGIAVICGRASGGLAVRDFDRADAYQRWAAAHPDEAAALATVKTVRGHQVYGRLDHEAYADLGDGELRADSGHYVLLPPSVHPDGPVYRWLVTLPDGPLPLLPSSLMQPAGASQRSNATESEADPADPSMSSKYIAWWTCSVVDTLPTGPGQRNRCLFELARRLKALRPDTPREELRQIVRAWYGMAARCTSGTHGFGDYWTDFVTAWQRVKRPAGQSFANAAALADAADKPAFLEPHAYDGPLLRLAALCWQLQQQWGDRPFPLGCEVAGKYLGVTARHAGRLLQTLRFDGVIQRVSKGNKASGKASTWKFLSTV